MSDVPRPAIHPEALQHFPSGAVRSGSVAGQKDKPIRLDLIPWAGLRRLGETMAEGAEKYGDHNWQKGMPSGELLNHSIAHVYSYLDGDRSEDHLAHAAFGLFAAIHFEEHPPGRNTMPEHSATVALDERGEREVRDDILGHRCGSCGASVVWKETGAGERVCLDAYSRVFRNDGLRLVPLANAMSAHRCKGGAR